MSKEDKLHQHSNINRVCKQLPLLLVCAALASAATASSGNHHNGYVGLPDSTITGPIACGTSAGDTTCSREDGLPQSSKLMDSNFIHSNYQEQEFFIEGDAISYSSDSPLSTDGMWNDITVFDTQHYKTRIIVAKPKNQKKFNGTVLVEAIVAAPGFDITTVWSYTKAEILRKGYAYVGVTITNRGATGLPGFDADRYASISHPGDDFSYDIFTEVAKQLRNPSGVDLLGGLKVKRIIGTGHSATGNYLITYINAIQKLEKAYDGFLPMMRFYTGGAALNNTAAPAIAPPSTSGLPNDGTLFRADIGVPVLHYVTETDIEVAFDTGSGGMFFYRQPDSKWFRLWEVAGTAHGGTSNIENYGVVNVQPFVPECVTPPNDGKAISTVGNAALFHLNKWVKYGRPAPRANRLSVTGPEVGVFPVTINRDNDGNALNGIRTPFVDVPINAYNGTFIGNGGIPGGNPGSALCALIGVQTPLEPDVLDELYPNRFSYIYKVIISTVKAVKKGFVLPHDGIKIIKDAIISGIGDSN